MKSQKTFLVLDGNALLHRAWHAIPPLTTKDGRVVNAVYGFAMVIEKMREQFKPDYMAVAWDLPGKTFRHKEFALYKAQREKKADELYAQIEWIQELLDIFGIPSLSAKGFEADDIIGTLAKKFGPKKDLQVKIVTGDMDALQLVDDNVAVIAFVKGLSETKIYNEEVVKERYGGISPKQLVDLKAIMGDPSDNVPGITGIGQKGAQELILQFGSIDGIFKALKKGDITQRYEKKLVGQEATAKQMQRLMGIIQNVSLKGFKIAQAEVKQVNIEKLIEFYRDLEFKRLVEKYTSVGAWRTKPSERTKPKQNNRIDDINGDQIFIYVERGQLDLFGASGLTVAISDGEKTAVLEAPDKATLDEIAKILMMAKSVVGHDLKDILHTLFFPTSNPAPHGCWVNIQHPTYFDTKIAAYLLAAGSRAFSLDECAYDYLGGTVLPSEAAGRLEIVKKLKVVLEKELLAQNMLELAQKIEFPLISILYQMETEGINVDQNHLKKLSVIFKNQLSVLTAKIYKLAGREFNINSPSQLADVLFVGLLLPTRGIKHTKTGYSTAASELEKLWDAHEIIPLISEYRELAKLQSTYIEALPKLIAKDGCIHTSFNQTVTATGRLSSSDPNLQNIPIRTELGNEIRKAFVAPDKKVLLSVDYSQFELRLAAVIAKDTSFIRAFQDGADIHARTAAEVLGKDEKDVTKAERSAAKAINFGILYGMGPRNLARSTGFSQDEARAFLDKYFTLHPGIADYIDEMKVKARHDGFAETLFGRRRYLPDINSGIQQLVAGAERMAMNMPIQGTQADLVKMAMIEIDTWIKNHNFDVKMLLQVHDELVFEVAKKDLNAVVPQIKKIMESVWHSEVPLVVDCEVGMNWGEQENWEK